MRYSKEHKAETHERIVKNASMKLREKGAEGIGIADLMKDAGLTHGGFYAHFESRDALLDEAFVYAMAQIPRRWRKRIDGAPQGEGLAAIVDSYLTPQHRDNIGRGCVLPSLSAEIARSDSKTRKVFAGKLDAMIELIAAQMPGVTPDAARKQAIAMISIMMGSLSLARAAGSNQLSSDILEAGRLAALDCVGGGYESPSMPDVKSKRKTRSKSASTK